MSHLFALFGLLLGACYLGPSDDVVNDKAVVTAYDPRADFSAQTTFAINPTISVIVDTSEPENLEEQYAKPIRDELSKQLKDRGYTEVTKDDEPDMGVNVVVLKNNVVYYYGYPYYWWGYPYSGGSGYWGFPGYGYYPPWGFVGGAYQTGTMVVEVVNLKVVRDNPPTADQPKRIGMLWTSLVYSVAGSAGYNVSIALDGIDQAFIQSPYFKK